MPKIPYQPYPDVVPGSGAIPKIGVSTPPDVFGANIGGALQSAGAAIERGANELYDRALAFQQMRNETTARNISVDVATQMGQMREDYLQKRGVDAAPALRDYQQQLQDYRQKTLENIQNPFVKKMVDSEVTGRINRDLDYAGNHSAEETRKSYSDSAKARINLAKTDALNNWGDDIGFRKSLDIIRQENAAQGVANGLTKDITDYQTYDDIAEANRNRVYGMAVQNPEKARGYYNQHKEEFGRFKPQVEAHLEQQEANVGSRHIEQTLTNGDYTKRVIMQESSGNMFIGKHQPGVSTYGPFGFTDGTWKDVAASHPELNLPKSTQGASVAQQKAAFDALTADNQKYLEKNEVPVNQQNSYLAHFFGKGGAVTFYNGMKADPGQLATNLASKEAVAANRSIFYNPDGTPRTAQSAYTRLTARFAGPGELTREAGASYLKEALEGGRQLAMEMNKDNPALLDNTLTRLRHNYEVFHSTIRQAEINDRDQLIDTITDHGSYGNPITSRDSIDQNPVLKSLYDHLPGDKQREIDRWIDRAAKRIETPTPEMNVTYETILGKVKARQPEAMVADLTQYKLTNLQMAKLKNAQLAAAKAQDSDHILEHAMSVTRNYRKANNILSGSDDEFQWQGSLEGRLQAHRAMNNGANPDDKTLLNWGSEMSSQIGGVEFGGFRFFGHPAYQPTSDFRTKFAPAFEQLMGRKPDEREVGLGYMYALQNPDTWETELKNRASSKRTGVPTP